MNALAILERSASLTMGTGLTFFLLGALRLGALIGFFPRHILVGCVCQIVPASLAHRRNNSCIGGVGVFLVITGLVAFVHMTVSRVVEASACVLISVV